MQSITAPAPSPSSHAASNWRTAGFGVYVHWPFCQAKCPYCDFNSHVAASIDQVRWARALSSEIRRAAAATPDRIVSSVFLGGGTPSLMSPETVGSILDAVRAGWSLANDVEVTLEANPSSVESERFRGYRQAGVNRLSLGVQSLDDAHLKALGRLHTADQARTAIEIARREFDRISFDLIYARQDQSLEQWRAELTEALRLSADHLSLYQLTIEDGTAFGDRFRRGRLRGLPDEDLSADLFEATQEMCAAAGLDAYEVSNHARAGAESRHNLIYWRSGDWVGVGPGAHGRITNDQGRLALEAISDPWAWLDAVAIDRQSEQATRVATDEVASEYLMMGLRLAEGISIARLHDLGGAIDPIATADLEAADLIERSGDRLAVTRTGRPVLNAILRKLL